MISVKDLLIQLSRGWDSAERELSGAAANHSKRVAVLAAEVGRKLGMDDERVYCLAGAALLRNMALTEYIQTDAGLSGRADLKTHCEKGQHYAEAFPWPLPITDFIKYHHEYADGSGPFKMHKGQYPLEAAVISACDRVDIRYKLHTVEEKNLDELYDYLKVSRGNMGDDISEALINTIDEKFIASLDEKYIDSTLSAAIPDIELELSFAQKRHIAAIIARLVDLKSKFTLGHSMQIADKAWYLARELDYTAEESVNLYMAAAMHDLGKLFISTEMLEKPGKINEIEMGVIRHHVFMTWDLLRNVRGMEKIAEWASTHHEKLDGRGYPFGRTEKELDYNCRLLACIDVYQAVRELRPYHGTRTHEEAMEIMYEMADWDELDRGICSLLDDKLVKFKNGLVPPVYTPETLNSWTPEADEADNAEILKYMEEGEVISEAQLSEPERFHHESAKKNFNYRGALETIKDTPDFNCYSDHAEINELTDTVRAYCQQLNAIPVDREEERREAMEKIFGALPDGVYIGPNFQCDFGFNIHFKGSAYINSNVTILDTASVTIGKGAKIASGTVITAAGHAIHPDQRAIINTNRSVVIKDNVWIGANCTICGGVTIGEGSVIGAGSVVTSDIPPGTVAYGVPCEVRREITEEDIIPLENIAF